MAFGHVTEAPNISPPYIQPLNIDPSNLSSLLNIKFIKNVTLPQVFSCILLKQVIQLVSPSVETLPKLIPQAESVRTTGNNTSRQLTDQSQQKKHCNEKFNMLKFNNKKIRTTLTVSLMLNLSLTLRILVPFQLTLNIFYSLYEVKYA